MLKLGYKLMSEEHGPLALVRNAQRAEQAGFDFAAISDHFFPWLDELPRFTCMVDLGSTRQRDAADRLDDVRDVSNHALPSRDYCARRGHYGAPQQ
jgi:alkanesulfonate monooxygenase SsuD/methylene tetrahydromethanopterin reductase-like flavin-dependent oxidoreductase (luciferase family)